MQILAPKDGYIVAILANNNDPVDAGTAIVQMDTTQEDLMLARITAIDNLRDLFAQRLGSPAIDLARSLSQIAVQVANIQEAAAAAASQREQSMESIGAVGPDLGQIIAIDRKATADSAPLNRQAAEANAGLFEYVVSEAAKVNAMVQDHIETKELVAAQGAKASCTLKALGAGKLTLNVTVGSFVLKGGVVFEVGQ